MRQKRCSPQHGLYEEGCAREAGDRSDNTGKQREAAGVSGKLGKLAGEDK
jgi:hypothetical protein